MGQNQSKVRAVTGYSELARLSVFAFSDAEALAGNEKTAHSMLARLIAKGLVRKIRNNMYTCVNPATGQVIASRYQIACASSSSAYISHHTAFEFYGLANQVYYEVYVASETRFRSFEFEGINYRHVASKLSRGVIEPRNSEGIRVTDLERTVVDSIKGFQKIGGLEELLNCLSSIHYVDEDKLRDYLNAYNIQGLYQKAGYLFRYYTDQMQLSPAFIDYCKSRIGGSTRYLSREAEFDGAYDPEWRMVIPKALIDMSR